MKRRKEINMPRQDTIARITEHLQVQGDEVLQSLLRLLERIPPEDDDWDRQIRADAEAGRLDKLADEALREFEAGDYTEL